MSKVFWVPHLSCVALDYPHQYTILPRLYISNNNPLGVPCVHFLLNTEKHTHTFLLLFPLTLHPFLAVPSCLFFSYLNLNSLLSFFISTHFFTYFFLVFAILWCWCEHPKEGRTEVMQSQQSGPLLQDLRGWVPFLALYRTSIKGWNNKCDPQTRWCVKHTHSKNSWRSEAGRRRGQRKAKSAGPGAAQPRARHPSVHPVPALCSTAASITPFSGNQKSAVSTGLEYSLQKSLFCLYSAGLYVLRTDYYLRRIKGKKDHFPRTNGHSAADVG